MRIKALLFATAILSQLHAEEAPAAAPAPAPAEAPLQASELIKKMTPHLVRADGKPVSVNLSEKDYVLVYWSASWCGPCRNFTPRFVEYYDENGGGKDFEIVLIGLDRSEEKMMGYATKSKMPWPVVLFDQKKGTDAKAYAEGGIPRLMIIGKNGEVIARGSAGSMLAKFKKLREKDPE